MSRSEDMLAFVEQFFGEVQHPGELNALRAQFRAGSTAGLIFEAAEPALRERWERYVADHPAHEPGASGLPPEHVRLAATMFATPPPVLNGSDT